MSQLITEARVKQYSANVFHLAQQKGSRLRSYVRTETQRGVAAFYDRIGAVTAQKKVGRHVDISFSDTPHSRRRVTLEDYFYADLVDKEDKLRIIQSPESEYAQAAMNALGRAMDDVIIDAALGVAYAGEEGGTPVSMPNSQKVAAFDGTTTTGVPLNTETLIAIKKKFWENEADDGELYICVGSKQLEDLLNDEKLTNNDYNTVRTLVNGDIDTFMGFKFIRSERLPKLESAVTYNVENGSVGAGTGTAPVGSRRCFAWQKQGVLLAVAADVRARISERDDKHYAMQVYASLHIGGTRLEEERVVEFFCKE